MRRTALHPATYAFNGLPSREIEGMFVRVRLRMENDLFLLHFIREGSLTQAARLTMWLYSGELEPWYDAANIAMTGKYQVYGRWAGRPQNLKPFALVFEDAVKLASHPTHPLELPAVREWVQQAVLRLHAEELGEL